MDKKELMAMMNVSLDGNLNLSTKVEDNNMLSSDRVEALYKSDHSYISGKTTAYNWWTDYYYPQIIRESYPIYIKERAEDKGRQAFEIIKHLQDKKLMRLDTVREFIEAMDTLLKIL